MVAVNVHPRYGHDYVVADLVEVFKGYEQDRSLTNQQASSAMLVPKNARAELFEAGKRTSNASTATFLLLICMKLSKPFGKK